MGSDGRGHRFHARERSVLGWFVHRAGHAVGGARVTPDLASAVSAATCNPIPDTPGAIGLIESSMRYPPSNDLGGRFLTIWDEASQFVGRPLLDGGGPGS